MPVETRSRRQSTLSFPCRKTYKTSAPKGNKTNIAPTSPESKPCSRSKSLSHLPCGQELGSAQETQRQGPATEETNGHLTRRVLPSKRVSEEASSKVTSSPSKSPRKRANPGGFNDENEEPVPCSPSKAKRVLCEGDKPVSPLKTPTKMSPSLISPLRKVCISRQENECYSSAKKALHTSQPQRILCREKEIHVMQTFLQDHVQAKRPGSLYVSGAPGTGKTACLKQILQNDKNLMSRAKVMFVNCMLVRQSQGIFNKVLKEFKDDSTADKMSAKQAAKALQKTFMSSGPMLLLVLDEIDHLDSKGQEVLYTMFEWPSLPRSRLVLVGVANALDLTDRILPRLQARPRCKPQLLHFAPYTRNQISAILNDRLKESSSDGEVVVEPTAVQLCARKVAAVAGDVRKALDVCRRAVEIVEADVRRQTVLKPVGSPRKLPTSSPRKSPKKSPKKSLTKLPKKVGLLQVSSVINDVYGSGMTSASNGQPQSFPMQQKLVICTMLLMVKEGKGREVTLGKVHDTYRQICNSRQVVPVDQSEFLSLCQLIETRGVLTVKKSKDARQSKMSLKLNEKEVEFALQDKILMSAILQTGLPCQKGNKLR
ncbi:cell division control protein 6 homolog isoform X1 [Diadema setosum]|uniref:cell division control protein 6 homolog isoform X1 n=1 Tax=Diadema setosum TaxID=31175 RepID=UPI003B3AE0F0